ncbi:MFS-type transporter SLC18B1-like [Amblyomma americanum]
MDATTHATAKDCVERKLDAAGLSVTPMLGTRNNASCPTPTLRGSPGRESPEFAEHGIDTARKTLLRFLYLTCFLQGVSCGILEPFCQNALEPWKVFGALASNGLHGCYVLGILLVTPWTAKLMLKDIKMRKLFSWGLFCEAVCCFTYEILKPFNHSLLTECIRVVQGFGASLAVPAYFFVVCVQFPDEISTLIPKFGALYSLGMVVWSYSGGYLFGAHLLMFPFFCVGCLLMLCSFWAPFILPQYRQKLGGFRAGIGSFLADESVLMDLAIMANSFLLFVTNRLSLADVLHKFGDANIDVYTVTVFSSPVYLLAGCLWTRARMIKFTIRLMSLLGTAASVAGLGIAASLDKLPDHPKQCTFAIVTSQVFVICGCALSFVSSFLHCYVHNTNEIRGRYSHIVLSGVTCTAISLGNILGIMFDSFVMEKLEYIQAVSLMLRSQVLVLVIFCSTAVYCSMHPRDVARMGYVNPDGTLRL